MSGKTVALRERAENDILSAVEYYASEGNDSVTLGFIDALQATFGLISRHSAAGSPRYAHELALPGLRSFLVRGYRRLIFYVEKDDHVDVWRVLHPERDIPESMRFEASADVI